VKQAVVHSATVVLEEGADEAAPGAAVTVALCGHWDHEGACRWPHHSTVAARDGQAVTLRTIVAFEPGERELVGRRIALALRSGRLDGPSGSSRWSVATSGPAELTEAERRLAERLVSAVNRRGDV
jgi:hypothetical protein